MPKKPKKQQPERHRLPLLPLRDMVLFPQMVVPLLVGRPASLAAVEEAVESDRPLLLCTQRDSRTENPEREDLYSTGIVAGIHQTLRMPDGTMKVVVEAMERVTLKRFYKKTDCHEVLVERVKVRVPRGKQTLALMRTTASQFEEHARLSQRVAPEILMTLRGITDPEAMADYMSAYLTLPTAERQELLETIEIKERLEKLSSILMRENDMLKIEQKVRDKLRDQMEKGQREYYLHEQLKAIRSELGHRDDGYDEFTELRELIDKAKMPADIKKKAIREFGRFERMPSMSPESSVVRTYLEWLVEMPWQKRTRDKLDLRKAQKVLDQDHYGLKKIKERILEFLAVRKLSKTSRGPILCLVGPPGVGKTSLGRSIAHAMGRKFVRVSLGGVRDQAEIRGHRRTYVGALPGRIIQSIRKVGVRNPLFMLDEIDKMSSDFRGDPSAALLEVLDPEQNKNFSDHYLEIETDLSEVFFITTANSEYEIPDPLLDRMEVVRLSGYSILEKENIAKLFLIPKQLEATGLTEKQVKFTDSGLDSIIQCYTFEAGVRELERQVAAICRKVAKKIVMAKKQPPKVVVDAKSVIVLLGPPRYDDIRAEKEPLVGVAVGLAWTMAGGDILHIETSTMKGKGALTLTGQLGDVMEESAQAAYTYIRTRAKELKIPVTFHKTMDLHVHVPEGGIPKDGPSAGISMAVSMLSALTNREPKKSLAMTGEITLRGRVLSVGGIKEKVLAAHRAGIRTLIIPKNNEKDLVDVPKEVKRDIKFIFVANMDQVFKEAFTARKTRKKKA